MINVKKNITSEIILHYKSCISRLMSRVLCLISLVLYLTSPVFGQIPPPPGQFGEIDTLALRDTIPFDVPDTSAVKFFYEL